MKNIKIDFKKYIYDKDKIIFELVKTKTNKYYLVEYETKRVIANNKKEILQKIKEYKGDGKYEI